MSRPVARAAPKPGNLGGEARASQGDGTKLRGTPADGGHGTSVGSTGSPGQRSDADPQTTSGPKVALRKRPCTICTHPRRALIDADLVATVPERAIASRYDVSRASVQRHRDRHMAGIVKAVERHAGGLKEAREEQHVQGVVALLQAGYRRTRDLELQAQRLAKMAEEEGKLGTAVMAVGEVRQTLSEQRQHLTVVGKATGEIQSGPTVAIQINIGSTSMKASAEEAARLLARAYSFLTEAHPELADEFRAYLLEGATE